MSWERAGEIVLVLSVFAGAMLVLVPVPEEPVPERVQRVEQLGQDRWTQKKLPEVTMGEDVERSFAGLARYEVVPSDGGYVVRERP